MRWRTLRPPGRLEYAGTDKFYNIGRTTLVAEVALKRLRLQACSRGIPIGCPVPIFRPPHAGSVELSKVVPRGAAGGKVVCSAIAVRRHEVALKDWYGRSCQ